MYKIGELVVYSNEGVCKIEEISELNIPGVNKSKKYYILAPMHGNGKVFVPIDTKAFMRAIITYEEIQNSISKVSLIDNFEHDMKNARALEDHYKKLLKSYECIDLLNIMASIDNKKNNLMKNGKNLIK
ncbi:CarD-like/TRCF domain [uncultured Clostridium sp.]|nr:CarD-like/TRCF domain [uncultured Clostridium sp.]